VERRILHAIDSLGIGGAQAMMFELYAAIQKYYPEYEQNIILLNRGKKDEQFIESYGIQYAAVNPEIFVRTLSDYQEPIVLVYHKLMCSKTDIYRRMYRKIPIIVVNHTYSDSVVFNQIRECTYVVSVSQRMKKRLKQICSNLNHHMIYNGVNHFRYADIPAKARDEPDVLLTGRINSLNAIKYNDGWQKWIAKIRVGKKLVHEYMGGGCHYVKACKQVHELNRRFPNQTRMLGSVHTLGEKVSILKSWDLFLYEVNRNEGVSIAILEALACGVPVICSNHFGNKEIIEEGVNGYVFESRGEAVKILRKLAENPDRLAELKKTTLEHFLENLDGKIMADQYIKLVERAAAKYQEPLGRHRVRQKTQNVRRRVQSISNPRKRFSKGPQDKKKKTEKTEKTESKRAIGETMDINLMDRFTILTSAYNNGKYLKDWAKSIAAQAHRPVTAVLVDDASVDNTQKVLGDVARILRDADVEFIPHRNKSRLYCGSSYAVALSLAPESGYYAVIDGDDMIVDDAMEYVVNLYQQYKDVTWIYTQFQACGPDMRPRKIGISSPPRPGLSLLDMGKKRIHSYSHWRTFCARFRRKDKLFGEGLRCAVDKYMGYRLEEFGKGMFTDRICYKYRQGVKRSISHTEQTKAVWAKVIRDAENRRKRYHLKAQPIIVLKDA